MERLKRRQNLQLPQAGGIGTPANALNGPSSPGQPGTPAQPGATGQPNAPGQPGQSGTPPAGSGSGTKPPATTGPGATTAQVDAGSQAIPTGDTPTIVGGNIIGVGGKVNKSSIMI